VHDDRLALYFVLLPMLGTVLNRGIRGVVNPCHLDVLYVFKVDLLQRRIAVAGLIPSIDRPIRLLLLRVGTTRYQEKRYYEA
jgi:hypothetical protein